MKWSIELSREQYVYALKEGMKRWLEVWDKGFRETHGSERAHTVYGRHIEGACGEYAFGLCAGLDWEGKGRVFGKDIRDAPFEIRTAEDLNWQTPRAPNRLWAYPSDPDDFIVWFVTGGFGRYTVRGWLPCRDIKRMPLGGSAQRPGTAHYIGREALNPPDSFDFAPVRAAQAQGRPQPNPNAPPVAREPDPAVRAEAIAKLRRTVQGPP
jgi:hypothetical protein